MTRYGFCAPVGVGAIDGSMANAGRSMNTYPAIMTIGRGIDRRRRNARSVVMCLSRQADGNDYAVLSAEQNG